MNREWIHFNNGRYRRCACCAVLFCDDSCVVVEHDIPKCVYCDATGAAINPDAREWTNNPNFTATRIDDRQGDLFG